MAFKYSTGFKNNVLDTGSVKSTFDGSYIKLYSGTPPASADDAISGDSTLLNTYTVGDDGSTGLTLESAASDGQINKNSGEAWEGTAAASGTATYFRVEPQSDDQSQSTSFQRIQGTVGGGGADLFLANTSIVSGNTYVLDFFSLTFAANN